VVMMPLVLPKPYANWLPLVQLQLSLLSTIPNHFLVVKIGIFIYLILGTINKVSINTYVFIGIQIAKTKKATISCDFF